MSQKTQKAIKFNKKRELEETLASAKWYGVDDLRDSLGRSPIALAASYGKLNEFKLLVSKGFDPNDKDKHGLSVLTYACWKDHDHIVSYMLDECGCDPTGTADMFGLYPIHKAAGYGSCKALQVLLDHGANVNVRTANVTAPAEYEARSKIETPLAIASRLGFHDAMRVLIAHPSCQIDLQDEKGDTPLHHACRKNDWRAAQVLVSSGSDTTIKNHDGFKPSEVADSMMLRNAVNTGFVRLYPVRILELLDT